MVRDNLIGRVPPPYASLPGRSLLVSESEGAGTDRPQPAVHLHRLDGRGDLYDTHTHTHTHRDTHTHTHTHTHRDTHTQRHTHTETHT